jgi:ACS family hexuronate transporter-like MFS transporter
MFGWAGGLGFSLLIGALADSVGFAPLFSLLGIFDLAGAVVLFLLLRPIRLDAAMARA